MGRRPLPGSRPTSPHASRTFDLDAGEVGCGVHARSRSICQRSVSRPPSSISAAMWCWASFSASVPLTLGMRTSVETAAIMVALISSTASNTRCVATDLSTPSPVSTEIFSRTSNSHTTLRASTRSAYRGQESASATVRRRGLLGSTDRATGARCRVTTTGGERIVKIRRTPDDRFASLPGFGWEPRCIETSDGLRVAYLRLGDADAPVVLMLHGELHGIRANPLPAPTYPSMRRNQTSGLSAVKRPGFDDCARVPRARRGSTRSHGEEGHRTPDRGRSHAPRSDRTWCARDRCRFRHALFTPPGGRGRHTSPDMQRASERSGPRFRAGRTPSDDPHRMR